LCDPPFGCTANDWDGYYLQLYRFTKKNPDVEMEEGDLPDFEEMEESAEPRGPHAGFYDHE